MHERWKKMKERLSRCPVFRLLFRYEELIRYGIVGVMTTLVNLAVYLLLSRILFPDFFAREPILSPIVFNWCAWSTAVLFAFFANRLFVFADRARGLRLLLQLLSFVALRLASGALENFSPTLLIKYLKMHDLAAKILVSLVIILLNYLFTKFITFRKKGGPAAPPSDTSAEAPPR